MADPQPTDAHLRVAHSINEAIMTRDFTKRQRKILDLILRLSWGCGSKDSYIPHQRDFSVVGVHEVDIKSELEWLQASGIIGRDGSFYWFNKNFDEWQVSRVKPYQPEKLSKLLNLNLNGNRPKLSETLSENLVKHEVSTKQNTKFHTPKLATPKESIKESIKEKNIYGEFNNVLLSDTERDKLIERFSKKGFEERVEKLSVGIESKGYKYKSHYATILNWASRDEQNSTKNPVPDKSYTVVNP